MKYTFFALLKFNLICGAVVFGYWLYTVGFGNKLSHKAELFFILMFLIVWFIQNATILIQNRKRMLDSVFNKTLDIAAASIEFKDAARARVQERMEERKR